jgi:hypothetical protein
MKRSFFILFPPPSCCLDLVDIYAGLNPYAYLGPLTLYNRIGFERSRGSQSPKLRTRIAPNGLRFIVRVDEPDGFPGSRICNQRFQRVRSRVRVV